MANYTKTTIGKENRIAPQYPEVTTDYMFVDNAAMKMLQDPCFFDVMVTENTFGRFVSDSACRWFLSF